ncbi:hypothetical protein EV424DRAFT_1440258 [Suillus variegatus]|nr:hypothetical protein EV424DRAFT_1440258 [Suillus variegatus]
MSGSTPAVVASSAPLYISNIVIRLDDTSKKKVDFAELNIDSQRQEIRHISEQDRDLSKKFDPAIPVTTEQVSLSVHCYHTTGLFPRKIAVNFSLNRKDILANIVDHDGQRVYKVIRRKLTVVITIRQLQSTSSSILEICPRFRLLVIGKTGVGKSSLIQQAFKIKEVKVDENKRGEADINEEFTAPENERFVVHDNFIARRRNEPELQDKIHAVWLCLSIPHANGRLLENGVEEFLKSRQEILGDIPIIAVFTKHDVFVSELELEAADSDRYDEAALEQLKVDELDRLCIRPLKEVAGSDILHITVSAKQEHESTIRRLVDLTTTNVETFVASEAALVMMMAQRVDIGSKRYWRGLASSMNFAGFTMLDCLSVIHKDIIDVWNFHDPHCHLSSDQFKELILKDIDNADLPRAAQAFGFGLTVVAAIASILTALAGPALPIVVPIAAGAVLAKFAYDTYQQKTIVLRRIMTYIVDLTCIMQILFLLALTGPISPHIIKIAIRAYEGAGKSNVHLAIQSHHVSVNRNGGDHALDEIVRLINDYTIKAEEVQDLRTRIGPVDLRADEEW